MVKKYKRNRIENKSQSIPIFSQVETPHGIGIVIEISGVDGNGLYFRPETVRFLVWYAVENPYTEWTSGELGKHISYWYKSDELEVIN